jgi:hypothetical protein
MFNYLISVMRRVYNKGVEVIHLKQKTAFRNLKQMYYDWKHQEPTATPVRRDIMRQAGCGSLGF